MFPTREKNKIENISFLIFIMDLADQATCPSFIIGADWIQWTILLFYMHMAVYVPHDFSHLYSDNTL